MKIEKGRVTSRCVKWGNVYGICFWLPNVATSDCSILVNKIKRHIYMGLS